MQADRLLLGAQNSLSAQEYATRSGDLMWGSRPITQGPHSELLRLARDKGQLSDDDILQSSYGEFARTVIDITGNFFEAEDCAGILEVARDYLARRDEPAALPSVRSGRGRSLPGSHIRVAPIQDSDCYQIVDGHHRAAALAAADADRIRVRPSWTHRTTPLQDVLDDMSWIGSARELYQPLDAPELRRSWVLVRRCEDRLAKMQTFLSDLGIEPAGTTFLDVACCYGWFVAKMRECGYSAHGIERDPLSRSLAEAAYGLDPSRIDVGDAVDLLQGGRRWDVVSCLSLLHHFALGRGAISAVEFVSLLDKATMQVLFLDTGQSHEEWLRRRLPGWHTDDIRHFLRKHTTFDEIHDLGPDADAVGRYSGNYGRHLFACVRTQPLKPRRD